MATQGIQRLRYQAAFNRASKMSPKAAIATLKFLCQIGESDFASQLAAKNPQWRLEVKDGTVRKKN